MISLVVVRLPSIMILFDFEDVCNEQMRTLEVESAAESVDVACWHKKDVVALCKNVGGHHIRRRADPGHQAVDSYGRSTFGAGGRRKRPGSGSTWRGRR